MPYFWPYFCFKRHAPDITLSFLTNKMKLASSGNTLTATTCRNFCYWFLGCQDFVHSWQNNTKIFRHCFHSRRVSLHGTMQECADIPVLTEVQNATDELLSCSALGNLLSFISKATSLRKHRSSKTTAHLRSRQGHSPALCRVNTCHQLNPRENTEVSLLGWLIWFGWKYKWKLISWVHSRNDWGEKMKLNGKIMTTSCIMTTWLQLSGNAQSLCYFPIIYQKLHVVQDWARRKIVQSN